MLSFLLGIYRIKMKDKGVILTRDKIIFGKEKHYRCWEIRSGDVQDITGSKYICLALNVSLPKTYKIISIEFADLQSFMKRQFSKIIYSYIFIPVSEARQATSIIKDIKACDVIRII